MKRFLISGFEPIFGIKRTPSGELVKSIASGSIILPSIQISGVVLPQIFRRSFEILKHHITTDKPDYIIMLGASPKASGVRLEQFAINIEDSRSGDNSRIPVFNRFIYPESPAAYSTSVDLKWLLHKLKTKNIPSEISYNAGTHTCNSLYYEVLHHIKSCDLPTKALFIHIPFTADFGVPVSGGDFDNFHELCGAVGECLIALSESNS